MVNEAQRLFVALDPPDDLRGEIGAWQERAAPTGDLRPVAAANLHVTVGFLGRREAAEAVTAARIVTGAPALAVPARLLPDPVPLPARRPRLLALAIESDAARDLAARIRAQLAAVGLLDGGIPPPGRAQRDWWPHMTVFRLPRRDARGTRGTRPRDLPEMDAHVFGFRRIALYRSVLRSEGAHYSRLAANELPQPA